MTNSVTYAKAVDIISHYVDKDATMLLYHGSAILSVLFDKDSDKTLHDITKAMGFKGVLKK